MNNTLKATLSHTSFWLVLLSQKVVTALDKTWHPEHFFCAQCGSFFGAEGTVSHRHGTALSLGIECLLGSKADMVALLWWLLCCFMPNEPFCVRWPSGFHEKDGKAYCRKDYFDMFAPKCGGCARAILENYISALNSLWHPECFVCRVSHSDLLETHPESFDNPSSWVLQPFLIFFFFLPFFRNVSRHS